MKDLIKCVVTCVWQELVPIHDQPRIGQYSNRRSLVMEESSDSHEFSEGWPSSSLSGSYDEDAESSVDEVKQEPGVMVQSWSRDSQHRSDQPRRQPRPLPTSLPRHSGSSHPGGPLSTRNPGFSRTLPPLDSSIIPPRLRNLPGQNLPDRLPSIRDLPSSHLHLPSFSVLDDLPPISPAASQSSNDSWLGSWPSLTQSEYVDLTNDPSPPIMPPTTRTKRRASRSLPSEGPSIEESSTKRRKTAGRGKGVERLKKEDSDPPEVDLAHVNDDNSLEKALENQQEKVIKAQREEQGDEPVKLAGLQCIICLETMVNITATHCGELAFETHPELLVTDPYPQRSFILPYLSHGSSHRRRAAGARQRQILGQMPRLSEEGHTAKSWEGQPASDTTRD